MVHSSDYIYLSFLLYLFPLLFLDLFRIHIIHCHDFTLVFFRLVNTALQFFFSLGTLDIRHLEVSFFSLITLLSHLSTGVGLPAGAHILFTSTFDYCDTGSLSHLISCLAHTQYQYRNVFMHTVPMIGTPFCESKYKALSRLVYAVNVV